MTGSAEGSKRGRVNGKSEGGGEGKQTTASVTEKERKDCPRATGSATEGTEEDCLQAQRITSARCCKVRAWRRSRRGEEGESQPAAGQAVGGPSFSPCTEGEEKAARTRVRGRGWEANVTCQMGDRTLHYSEGPEPSERRRGL